MELISDLLPKDVLDKYIEMYDERDRWTDKDVKEWTDVFGIWMTGLLNNSIHGHEEQLKLSLNRTNFLGKKTRALLVVMKIKEPKTLRDLKQQFIDFHSKFK